MRMPDRMPARTARSNRPAFSINDPSAPGWAQGIEPAACCAETCVNVPFVGRVCHCVLELPICP